MVRVLGAALCLIALINLQSCTPGYEAKGNEAYKAAAGAQGDEKRRLEKEAYMYYYKAVKENPNKISNQLRNRFIELTVNRANMVLVQGSSEMDHIPLFMDDIDSLLTNEVSPERRNQYAQFLVTLADSNFTNQRIYEGLEILDRAAEVAVDSEPILEKKETLVGNLAKENFEIAQVELEQYARDKEDVEPLIRAEYRLKLAKYYDEDNEEIDKLLSEVYSKNAANYSAYEAVVMDKPDTTIYDKINEYSILLAVPTVKRIGKQTVMNVNMYNYSWNPLRLSAGDFYVVGTNGKKYKALKSSKIDKEILDQEHEIKMILRFPARVKVEKVVYKNGDHYTEKRFF